MRRDSSGQADSAREWARRSRGAKAAIGLAAWSAVGVIFAIPGLASGEWRPALLASLAHWWAWGLLALVIVAFDRRLPIPVQRIGLRLIAHVPLSLIVTAASLYVSIAIRAAMGLTPWTAVLSPNLLTMSMKGGFYWSWLIYWLVTGAWLAWHYHDRFRSSELRAEKAERLFSEARLNALRMQLDPHFLFNALHAISSQIDVDPALARQMIEHLGNLLRSSLGTKDKQLITLSEEMLVLDHYLEIQRIRFGRRFTFRTDISDAVRHALIPSLMMQPLVENAIRHGISKRREGGTVTVSARRENDLLRISVEDDGVGLPADWKPGASEGLGLSVTRQRVTALGTIGEAAGDAAGEAAGVRTGFRIGARAGGGTRVDITLPYQTEVTPVLPIEEPSTPALPPAPAAAPVSTKRAVADVVSDVVAEQRS